MANNPIQIGELSYDPSTGTMTGTPQRKKVPNLSELLAQSFGQVQGMRGDDITANPILSEQVRSGIQSATSPIRGLGEDYWKGLQNQATQRLQEQFFDPGGISEQVEENVASRGLVGSGVEQDIMRESVYNPYAREATNIIQDIASQQAAHGVDIEKFNRELGLRGQEMLTNLAIADRSAGMEADIANRNLDFQFSNLAAQMAEAEQGRLTQESMFDLETQLKQMELAINSYNSWKGNQLAEQELKLKALSTPMGDMSDAAKAEFFRASGNEVAAQGITDYGSIETITGDHRANLKALDKYGDIFRTIYPGSAPKAEAAKKVKDVYEQKRAQYLQERPELASSGWASHKAYQDAMAAMPDWMRQEVGL